MKKENTNVITLNYTREYYLKSEIIRAIKWFLKCSTKEATEWYFNTDRECHNQITFQYLQSLRKMSRA